VVAALFIDLAPLVAIAWFRLLAVAFNVEHVNATAIALGLFVWLVYTSDRTLDVLAMKRTKDRSGNTIEFGILFATLFALFGTDVYLALKSVNSLVLIAIAPVFLGVVVYLGIVHGRAVHMSNDWPREILVGVLFALGFSLPIAALMAHRERLLLLYPFLAVLATLNCCGVKRWASLHPQSRHKLTRWIGEHLNRLGFGLALAAGVLRMVIGGPVLLAIVISASILALLPVLGKRWTRQAWYMAADIALCSPLLLPVFWK